MNKEKSFLLRSRKDINHRQNSPRKQESCADQWNHDKIMIMIFWDLLLFVIVTIYLGIDKSVESWLGHNNNNDDRN